LPCLLVPDWSDLEAIDIPLRNLLTEFQIRQHWMPTQREPGRTPKGSPVSDASPHQKEDENRAIEKSQGRPGRVRTSEWVHPSQPTKLPEFEPAFALAYEPVSELASELVPEQVSEPEYEPAS